MGTQSTIYQIDLISLIFLIEKNTQQIQTCKNNPSVDYNSLFQPITLENNLAFIFTLSLLLKPCEEPKQGSPAPKTPFNIFIGITVMWWMPSFKPQLSRMQLYLGKKDP